MREGVISTLLREVFGPDVADWPAVRLPESIDDMDPSCYIGIDLDPTHRGDAR